LNCGLGTVMGMFLGNLGKRPLKLIIQILSGDNNAYFCTLQSIAGFIITSIKAFCLKVAYVFSRRISHSFVVYFHKSILRLSGTSSMNALLKMLILSQNILFGISLREVSENSYNF
jgi:hypothetical protein